MYTDVMMSVFYTLTMLLFYIFLRHTLIIFACFLKIYYCMEVLNHIVNIITVVIFEVF